MRLSVFICVYLWPIFFFSLNYKPAPVCVVAAAGFLAVLVTFFAVFFAVFLEAIGILLVPPPAPAR